MHKTVAYILAEYPVPSETFIRREIAALQARGFTIIVCALRRPRQRFPMAGLAGVEVFYGTPAFGPSFMAGKLRFISSCPGRYLRAFRHALGGRTAPLEMLKRLRRFAVAVKLARWARQHNVAHVHAHFAYVTADVGRAMATLLDTPFSVSAHAWDIYAQPAAAIEPRLKAAEHIFACTRHVHDHICGLFPALADRLILAHHGLDPDEFDRAEDPEGEPPLILGVGRLEQKKGFCYLVDACHILKVRGVEFQCRIIGDGSKRQALSRMVATLELADSVEIAGPLPPEGVFALYRKAAVLVLPSVIGSDNDRDGLANVLLEAMAAGIPVISTTASAADEAVQDGKNGFVVPPDDPDAIAEQLEKLLEQPNLRRQLGTHGRQTIRDKFDIHKNIEPFATIFSGYVHPS